MFDKKMFIDTLKVSPEANLDTFGRVQQISEFNKPVVRKLVSSRPTGPVVHGNQNNKPE
jgi:hypothetical protein